MDIQKSFEKFYENIRLTPNQNEDAKSKYEGVCKKLHSHYYPSIEYNGKTKLLIGSYGKHTNIRPPRDVDVLFIMPGEKFEQYDDNESNGQSQLLQDIKDVLSEKYSTTEVIKAWGKVVLIKFSDGTHNIELLPAWENELIDGTFLIPNTANGGAWDEWDPRAEIKKIKDSDAETGKTKVLIRMIKKWTENCTISIKSYQIENAIVNFFLKYSSEQDYSITVRDFFDYLLKNNSNQEWESYIKTASRLSEAACKLELDDNSDDAIGGWKKIFGDDFKGIKKEEKILDLASLQKNYPSAKEEFLEKDYKIDIILNPIFTLRIDARVGQKGWMEDWLSNFILKKSLLLKQKSLLFKVIKNTVPFPYEVKWKVRNFGEEARDKDDLRGGITNDLGKEEKSETTRYFGEHYVECYVIKDGICVAFHRALVPIGNQY